MKDMAEKLQLTYEEQGYLQAYMEDLAYVKPQKEGEVAELLSALQFGDAIAKSRIIELWLSKVVELGKEMNHPEVFLGDLIQEGNVCLMMALEEVDAEIEDLEAYLVTAIRQGMQVLVEETEDMKIRDRRMVEKVQNLDEDITRLTEEMGRKVTVDELALFLNMPEEEIAEILKLAGEDVE